MKMRGIKPDFWTDEDVVEVSAFARLLFVGLWQMACDNGHIKDSPKRIKMSILPADDVDIKSLLGELVEVGLVRRSGGWISVPNLGKHQRIDRRYFLTCEHAGCVKPAVGDAENPPVPADPTTGTRRGHAGATPGPRDEGEGEGEGEGEKKRKASSSKIASDLDADPRAEVIELCAHLAERVRLNGHKAKITTTWHRQCRLLIDVDGHTPEQIRAAIDWATADPFWSANIRSMPTLREKYTTLRAQASRPAPSGTSRRQQETDAWFERSLARAQAADAAEQAARGEISA